MAIIHTFAPSKVITFGYKQIYPLVPFYDEDPADPDKFHLDYNMMKAAPFGQLLMMVPIKVSGGRTPSYKDLLTRIKISKTEICRIVVHGVELPYPVQIKLRRGVQIGDAYKGPMLEITKLA